MSLSAPPQSRPRQRGVVLILTLFVILITFALVTQLTIGTSVAAQTTRNGASRIQMRASGLAAAEQFLDLLRDDMAGEGGLDGMGTGDMSEGPGAGGGGFDSLGPAADEGEEGFGEEAEDSSSSDSFEDQWARPMRIQMGEVVITAWAQDECSKFNLLWLLAQDDEEREQAIERCTRIIDRLRDDFDDDLSQSEAMRITEQIISWLNAESRDLDYPQPLRHSDSEEEIHSLILFPEELLLLEDVSEELYYDQLVEVAGETWIAYGLESVFTVWTNMAFEPSTNAGDEEAATPPTGDTNLGDPAEQEFEANQPLEDPIDENAILPQGGLAGAAEGVSEIGTRININTAPRAVVESLLDTYELSSSVTEALLEFRNEVDEEALLEQESGEVDNDMLELEAALYGDDEQEPHKYFKSLETLEEVDEYAGLDQEVKDKLSELIGVQSDVFSVLLDIRVPPEGWQPEERYQEPRGPVLRLRGIFWRRSGGDGTVLVPIIPWHEVPHSRWRQPDFQNRLGIFYAPEF